MLNNLVTSSPVLNKIARVEMPSLSVDMIHSETMLFSADWGFARDNGGPLTQAVLDVLWPFLLTDLGFGVNSGLSIVIDTRCHMLMAGMLPAIGGWHCDDYPRDETYSQPDLSNPNDNIHHYTVTLSTNDKGVSNTLFLDSPITIPIADPKKVWKSVHIAVEERNPTVFRIPDNQIMRFGQSTLHKAEACKNPGWRYFFRLSVTHRKPQNKIRRQVQVYLPEVEGW